MEKILVGSKALKGRLVGFNREPSDTDFLINENIEIKEKMKTNTEYIFCPLFFKQNDFHKDGVATLIGMLNLKYSHLRRDLSWDKHMYDFQLLLSELGEKSIDREFCDELLEFWDKNFPLRMKRSNLELDKETFFTNAVNETIGQHDFLHTLINPTPAYTLLLKDGCEVELDEEKWNNSSFDFKWSVIVEETLVMGAERNYKTNKTCRQVFVYQLKENIKKHFPSYIAHFAIINYKEFLKKPTKEVDEKYNLLKKYLLNG